MTDGPPSCNTGVYPHAPLSPFAGSKSQFDWYRASVPMAPHDLLRLLCEAIQSRSGRGVSVGMGTPRWSFLKSDTVLDEKGRRIVEVLHGGANKNPCVEASSENAPLIASIIRDCEGSRVTRVDVAIDGHGPGLWEELLAICEDLVRKYGLKDREIGSRLDPNAGGTYYLGSRKSEVYFRIYRKGLKIAEEEGLAPELITDELRNWVRAEIEFKPKDKTVKNIVTRMEPGELWGVSEWLVEFAERALHVNAHPIQFQRRRPSDHERALRFMARQYSRHLEKLLVDCEGDREQAFTVLLDLSRSMYEAESCVA